MDIEEVLTFSRPLTLLGRILALDLVSPPILEPFIEAPGREVVVNWVRLVPEM